MPEDINRNKFVKWAYGQDVNYLRELNGALCNLPASAGQISIDEVKLVLGCVLQLGDFEESK